MPYYKHMAIGDFDVEIKPIGRWRNKPIMKQLAPYFAGNQPEFKIIIKKRSGVRGEMEFDADLFVIYPNHVPGSSPSMVGHIRGMRTPFEWNVESRDMLRTDGSTVYELSLTPRQHEGKIEVTGGYAVIAQISVITREVTFVQILVLVVVALLGAVLGYFLGN